MKHSGMVRFSSAHSGCHNCLTLVTNSGDRQKEFFLSLTVQTALLPSLVGSPAVVSEI